MKNWIRKKLLKFLGVDELKSKLETSESELKQTRRRLNALMGSISMGVDIDPILGGRSWAVLCLRGDKKTVVRFMDLSDQNLSEILDYLKHFEETRYISDAPPIFKQARNRGYRI